MEQFDLDSAIRKIPDFPAKGILFFDITSILTNPEAFSYCCNKMEEIFKDRDIEGVAAIESRGFLFAAPFALKRNIPLILIRKKGKLPGDTLSETYSLEYGEATVEVHKADIPQGKNILVIDDLLATGGTVGAAISLLRRGGANVTDVFGIIGLPFLPYKKVIKDAGCEVETLITYASEKME